MTVKVWPVGLKTQHPFSDTLNRARDFQTGWKSLVDFWTTFLDHHSKKFTNRRKGSPEKSCPLSKTYFKQSFFCPYKMQAWYQHTVCLFSTYKLLWFTSIIQCIPFHLYVQCLYTICLSEHPTIWFNCGHLLSYISIHVIISFKLVH